MYTRTGFFLNFLKHLVSQHFECCRLIGKTFPLIFTNITCYHAILTMSLLDLDELNMHIVWILL